MDISLPRARGDERRIAVTPDGCAALLAAGHRVLVEVGAGEGAGHADDDYARAGAQLVWSPDEAFGRADLVVALHRPSPDEVALMREGSALAGFLHLEAAPAGLVEALAARRLTALALELYEERGERPVLAAMSDIAGRLAPQLAARWLETRPGDPPGRGVLLSGTPGVPAAEVVVLGAGVVGAQAARGFLALGAQVTVLDHDLHRLRALEPLLHGARLVHASRPTIARSVTYAEVLVGAVHAPGQRAPVLVAEDDVRGMRRGAVVIDYSIDQGGCVATSRPTNLATPVYVAHGVLHCCLPNTTALVARTASHAISHELVRLLASRRTLDDAPLRAAAAVLDGRVVQPAARRAP